MMLVSAPNPTLASPLVANLAAYWKLDETSGNRLDSIGANDLVPTGSPGNAAGKINYGLSLVAASSQSVGIASNATLQTGDIDFTIGAWCYLTTLANETFVAKWSLTNNVREYLLYYNAGDHAPANRFSFGVSPNGTTGTTFVDATTFGVPSIATWYYVVAWHDSVANTLNIQVNNGGVNSVAYSAGVFAGSAPFEIGRLHTSTYYLNGRVDEVGLWKRVLTAPERTALYNSGAGLTYPFS